MAKKGHSYSKQYFQFLFNWPSFLKYSRMCPVPRRRNSGDDCWVFLQVKRPYCHSS